MRKLSKSDTTPEMEERDAEARTSLLNKKCQHFVEGTYIIQNNQRGLVLAVVGGTALCVEWEDGTVSTTYPIALRRNDGHNRSS